MPRTERGRELARRRTRKAKLKKLRTKFAAASNDSEREVIATKARRLSPFAKLEAVAESE